MSEAQDGNVGVKLANIEGCSLPLPKLDDIRVFNCPLNVQCNARNITVNKKGTLGTYPPKVWHNENGVAKILSMHSASKHFCLTMDTDLEDAICLHRKTEQL